MAKKKGILATVGRTGEATKEVALQEGSTAGDLLAAAGISIRSGEVLEREGEVIETDALINNNDVIFVTEDDDNG